NMPRTPATGNAADDVERMLNQKAATGQPLRAGDAPLYGSTGNMSAMEAMGEAGQELRQGFHAGMRIAGMIPGPIGVIASVGHALELWGEGENKEALMTGIGALARLNPCTKGPIAGTLIRGANLLEGA